MKRKLAIFALFVMLIVVLAVSANAETVASGTCGSQLNWILDDGTLTISGTGDMYSYNGFTWCAPWLDYASSISSVNMENGITSIARYAFYNCNNLASVFIPEGVTRIGECAFYGCGMMQVVDIPDSVSVIEGRAFYECSSLISVTIPKNVTSISQLTFAHCTSLKNINIGDGVEVIYVQAFYNAGLETITFPSSVTAIGEVFSGPGSSLKSVVFEGDAPHLGRNLFDRMIVTVYYPANNATWTEEVMQNYGGDVTWVPYTPEPEIEEFEFSGSTMTLGNTLEINFVINESDIQGEENYVLITRQYADNRGPVIVSVPQSSWKVLDESHKYVSFAISAKEMKDELTAAVYNANDQQISVTYRDSVADYCLRMLKKEEEKDSPDVNTMALFVDMLNYGAAAQIKWNYNTECLANAELSEEQKCFASAPEDTTNILSKGVGYRASSLSLKENILLNIVYNNSVIDKAAYAVVSYTDYKGNHVSYKVEEFIALNRDMKFVQIDTLKVSDYAQAVTVELYDAEGNVLSECVESIESYLTRNMAKDDLYPAIMAFCIGSYNYMQK